MPDSVPTALLVDDHPMLRSGLRRLLESAGIRVLGEAASGEQAYQLYMRRPADVVVMDLQLPGMGGLEAARRIVARDPDARVLVLSVFDSETMLARALDAGVRGYLTKQTEPARILEAVQQLLEGESCFDQGLIAALLQRGHPDRQPLGRLTPREFEVFRHLAEGHSVADIARFLSISPKTVGVHHTRLMHKLGLRNRADLVRLAFEHGVVKMALGEEGKEIP